MNGTKISKFQSVLDCPREEVSWSNIENINCPDFKSHVSTVTVLR